MNLIRKFFMADDGGSGYGYADDTPSQGSPFVFGLNTEQVFLKKFEWIPNGGKDGAEQEALEIIFSINGKEKSYRQFPVTHGFNKQQEKVTDKDSPEFKQALIDFNAVIVHILLAFVDRDTVKQAFSRPIRSFKEHCQIARGILPGPATLTTPLHIFMQYGYKIPEGSTVSFLEIPKNMKNGYWLCKAQPGTWVEKRFEGPITDAVKEALWYENGTNGPDGKPVKHPFVRSGYFINRPNAAQQRSADAGATAVNANAMNTGVGVNTSSNGVGSTPATGAGEPAVAAW